MDVGLRDMLCCQRLDLASSSVEDFWQHTVVGIFGDISRRGEMLVLSTQRTLLPTSAPCEPCRHPIHTRRHLGDTSTDDDHADHANDKDCGNVDQDHWKT